MRTGRGKEQRDEDIKKEKELNKERLKKKIDKRREAKKKLAEKSRHCFKQLFKFTNGMICLSCDANYKSFISNENGINYVQIDNSNCENLKKECYPYL